MQKTASTAIMQPITKIATWRWVARGLMKTARMLDILFDPAAVRIVLEYKEESSATK
jgi:hypothetical protein|tara:strand:+ start:3435 stop:3605 length:171 start_codon:yes stop_codon:yes gene_type:complete